MTFATSLDFRFGRLARMSAATPATCGAAQLEPLLVPVIPTTLTPGATSARPGPNPHDTRLSLLSLCPTQSTRGCPSTLLAGIGSEASKSAHTINVPRVPPRPVV